MAVEYILLYAMVITLVLGAFYNGNSNVRDVFLESGSRLGVRLERNIETGSGFNQASRDLRAGVRWACETQSCKRPFGMR